MRISAQIHSHAGNVNRLLVCAPTLEAFLAVEIGTMMRVVLFAVRRLLAGVALLGAADCNANTRSPEVVLMLGVVFRLLSSWPATLIFAR